MKILFFVSLSLICINGISQIQGKVSKTSNPTSTNTGLPAANQNGDKTANDNSSGVKPIQTATDRYLNGPSGNRTGTTSVVSSNAAGNSPFVRGVHPASNAVNRYDSTGINRNNVSNRKGYTSIAGGNDTTFNVNTLSAGGGVNTNSGAVDRSGQAQFGQSNWGTGRSTVGESQWTVPPPITASFNKDFPASNSATWTRNSVDTTIYSAKYKSGAQWVTTNYNIKGQRIDMRTEFPLVQPPRAVTVYVAKQPANFQITTIYKLQVQGRPDMYEIETANGKKIYINNDGMEVNY